MRCVIWAAVSSKPQASDEKESIPSQIEAARELLQGYENWHEAREPLVIPGHSRNYIFLADAAAEMPVYTELMELTRSGSIDLLICRGRDRLGRTDALIAQVEEYLASYNVQILSLSMPTRIQDPDAFAREGNRPAIWMRSIERARSQDEIAEMRARHRMGMRRRIQEGYHASKIPYGYRLGPEDFGIIHEPEAAVVRLLYHWLLQGLSYREMLRRLPSHTNGHHPTSITTIQQILINPYYSGCVAYHRHDRKTRKWRDRADWLVSDGLHQAIIDDETWTTAQREIEARRRLGSRSAHVLRPLSGLLFCGTCGSQMIIRGGSKDRGYRYYACETCADDQGIHRNTIRDDVAHQQVLDWLLERALKPELVQKELDELLSERIQADDDQAEMLSRAVQSKTVALERWRRDYEEGYLDRSEYYGHKLRLEDELAEAQSRLADLKRQAQIWDPQRVERLLAGLESISIDWTDPDTARRLKALFRQIGLRVEYARPDLSVRLAP